MPIEMKRLYALLFFCALIVFVMPAVSPAQSGAPPSESERRDLTARAYVFTLPSVIMYRTRWALRQDPAAAFRLSANRFGHRRVPATPESRAVTAPNVDTLYSSAWLDLSDGPVRLHVPATGDRYYSLQFMDFFTNSFAYIGRRTGTTAGGTFLIVGPDWRGEARKDQPLIKAPTNAVWLLGRFLFDGTEDLARANALQDALRLEPLSPAASAAAARPRDWDEDDPLHHFVLANRALRENPPPAEERDLMREFARIGVGPDGDFDPAALNARQRQVMREAIDGVETRIQGLLAMARGGDNGWTSPRADLGNYGRAYFYRAIVAKLGLGANIPAEAMYFRSVRDDGGGAPDGRHRYRLHFPAGALPPVDAFWSLTMYRSEADLRQFLVPNAIDRYAIGDRTPGLQRNADGSLDIHIQHEPPAPDLRANWLPAPAGPFGLSLRAYQPGPAMLSGDYRLPPLKRID